MILKFLMNHFSYENEAIVALEDFEAFLLMRERTPITKSFITLLFQN